jgi:hypothetical protein
MRATVLFAYSIWNMGGAGLLKLPYQASSENGK